MILVGNQRGGAKDLALHLLKEENDHVRVHELRGFASDDLMSALNESYAISRGTKCKQFLFSLSLNPPPSEQISTEEFEATIERAERELGLDGQPRAIVFHEKEGPGGTRRHAHAVWSRIRAEEMKAVQLSHTKRKLTALSREIFFERQWRMPPGLMVSERRDLRNFSFEEWGQAKRVELDPRDIKAAFQDCWAISDSRESFAHALDARGYKLAKGDKRAFVAVDMRGEIYAIPRWVGVRTKNVRARLGEIEDNYPSIAKRTEEFRGQIASRLEELRDEEHAARAEARRKTEAERKEIVERQRAERAAQDAVLRARWERETAERQARFNIGIRGLIDRLTGQYARLKDQNIAEAHAGVLRDRAERDAMVLRQMDERRALDARRLDSARQARERARELSEDIRRYAPKGLAPIELRRAEKVPQTASAAHEPLVASDREARREAFMRERFEQAADRERGPRRDLNR